MFFSVEISNITTDPIAVGMLRAVGVMMIAKHLPDLVHKFEVGIGPEFLFVFHDIIPYQRVMENSIMIFPFFHIIY